MGLRAGVDIVEVPDVEHSIRIHSGRYLERVYTAREVADCRRPGGVLDARLLAMRFAAKEAALKALRVGEQAVSVTHTERHAGALVIARSGPPG